MYLCHFCLSREEDRGKCDNPSLRDNGRNLLKFLKFGRQGFYEDWKIVLNTLGLYDSNVKLRDWETSK